MLDSKCCFAPTVERLLLTTPPVSHINALTTVLMLDSSTVAPIVHCVRHAQVSLRILLCVETLLRHRQGYHNLSPANYVMHDPGLTPLGEEQCRQLASTFPYHKSIELLVASPLRRTIYTALLAFDREVKRGMHVIALPTVQETSALPSDTGSDVDVLRKELADKPVDLSLVQEGWNSKEDKWAAEAGALERRAKEARRWLMARPEKEIVLVTHGGILHYLSEDWSDSGRFNGEVAI